MSHAILPWGSPRGPLEAAAKTDNPVWPVRGASRSRPLHLTGRLRRLDRAKGPGSTPVLCEHVRPIRTTLVQRPPSPIPPAGGRFSHDRRGLTCIGRVGLHRSNLGRAHAVGVSGETEVWAFARLVVATRLPFGAAGGRGNEHRQQDQSAPQAPELQGHASDASRARSRPGVPDALTTSPTRALRDRPRETRAARSPTPASPSRCSA